MTDLIIDSDTAADIQLILYNQCDRTGFIFQACYLYALNFHIEVLCASIVLIIIGPKMAWRRIRNRSLTRQILTFCQFDLSGKRQQIFNKKRLVAEKRNTFIDAGTMVTTIVLSSISDCIYAAILYRHISNEVRYQFCCTMNCTRNWY